ncbi:DUF1501 domain-containing protein [Zavarzinella formosa]|uniref:DUF1501 domain-containing protein n=1 Tax=Zavarzinella formosa TaxID=360055 RepID=UPI0002D81F3B|nr:DUF1501 domain-containing protein [Zavarzinella formosa]
MSGSFHIHRRDWLRLSAVGAVGLSQSGWLHTLAAEASKDPKRKSKSVILLWLGGGPATIDMWDLKPGHANGGPFKEIDTAVPGIRISEHLPKVAAKMKAIAIIRSMATREGDHARATLVGQTGYTPQGAIQFPALGSLVARELAAQEADLPGFVSIGGGRGETAIGGGFLGPRYSPFVVSSGGRRGIVPGGDDNGEPTVENLNRPAGVSAANQIKRLEMLAGLEKDFDAGAGSAVADSQRASTERAIRLMRPEAAAAFHLDDEKDTLRDSYGRSSFGQGCLLARRLVERGVPFVEVGLGGWDAHQNNFTTVERLSTNLDKAFAALLTDLSDRGLLKDTLIVCQGEFGRTPRVNGSAGRDHWPASWAAVLAGGGIKGGQAYGKTSKDGTVVESEPTRTADLIATVVKAVGIDPTKQNMSNVGRPIRIADPSGKPIKELL